MASVLTAAERITATAYREIIAGLLWLALLALAVTCLPLWAVGRLGDRIRDRMKPSRAGTRSFFRSACAGPWERRPGLRAYFRGFRNEWREMTR